MIIIDGKRLSQEFLIRIKEEMNTLPFRPVFCDVLVGDDKVSMQYVGMKAKAAIDAGLLFHRATFPASITTEELIKEIKILNKIQNMCGLILQLPLPPHLDTQMALDAVDPSIDVDCLGTVASEKFYRGEKAIGFPTALACIKLIDSLHLDLKGKKIVVLGQGNLVGKPVTALLRFLGSYPVAISIETKNKEDLIKEADLVISGIGKGEYITGDMIKQGAILIDAGTSESSSGIVGDVDLDSVKNVAGYASPVPGGVGPMTVAMLLHNVLEVAKRKVTENIQN